MRRIGISDENDAVSHANILNLRTKLFHDSDSLAADSCRKVRPVSARSGGRKPAPQVRRAAFAHQEN